jgi:hypothetical protein
MQGAMRQRAKECTAAAAMKGLPTQHLPRVAAPPTPLGNMQPNPKLVD